MSTDPNPARPGAYAAVNGLRVYYETHGDGRPLVLLHGGVLTFDRTFGPVLSALAENHQVIGIELQGHGHTADSDRDMTLENLASDVEVLLGQLGIDQADFFGFSLGGMVSLELAIRHIDHAAEMLGVIPGAQLAVLPGTRHMEVMQRVDQVLALVIPFLDAPFPDRPT